MPVHDAEQLRRNVTIRASLLGALLWAVLAVIHARWGRVGMCCADLAMLAVLLSTAASAWSFGHRRWHVVGPTLVVGVVFVVSAARGEVGGYLWLFVMPAVAYFLSGAAQGLQVSVALFALAVLVTRWRPPAVVDPLFTLHLQAALLFVIIFGWFSERERGRYLGEVERLSHRDPLTGAWNRRYFHLELARRARRPGPLGVVLIDLDDFKAINDRFGHAAGDRALERVVQALGSALPPGAVLARIGGDEFAAIVPDDDPERLRAVAERGRTAVEALRGPRPVRCSVSVGAAVRRPGEGPGAMLRRADAALYAAKRAGRNRTRLAA